MKRALQNGKEIKLYEMVASEIDALKGKQGMICPYCKTSVRLKSGPKRRPHFAHVDSCYYEAYENESKEHLMAKNLLAHWLQKQGIIPQLEKPLPKIRRVADIYFEHEGEAFVFEIQKSAISEALFNVRTDAYEGAGIRVLWVFIGELLEKSHSYVMNRVMGLNRRLPLIHLQLEEEKLTMFSNLVYISTKEIQATRQTSRLKGLKLEQLLQEPDEEMSVDRQNWLAIKQQFRLYKWQAYMKHERLLQSQCLRHRTNLSMLPAEVGWPVKGSGFRKYIFIWQAYALLSITAHQLGDYFSLSEIMAKMKVLYRFPVPKEAVGQLKDYFGYLAVFGIVKKVGNYYEYVRAPQFFDRLELAILEDQRLGAKVLSPGGFSKRHVG